LSGNIQKGKGGKMKSAIQIVCVAAVVAVLGAETTVADTELWSDGTVLDASVGFGASPQPHDPEPGTAYFSLQGDFLDGMDVQEFHFALANDVPGDRPFELRTWSYNGTGPEETNAAGEAIPGGGFDPNLKLFHPPETLLTQNSDIDFFSGQLDALIDHDHSTPGVPDPLLAGDYRLRLDISSGHFNSRDPGWAVDLVGPSEAMVLTELPNAGTDSTVTSLNFGTPDLGGYFSGTATAVVSAGETWKVRDVIHVAYTGDAALTVSDGGLVESAVGVMGEGFDSVGSLIVQGTDGLGNPSTCRFSDVMSVGDDGKGELHISGGGYVSAASYTYVGTLSSGSGSVTVDGTDPQDNPSTLAGRILYVGRWGTGSLTISGGGRVSFDEFVTVGYTASGAVTINGSGATTDPSVLTSAADLTIGNSASGSLTITGGGRASCSNGFIGRRSNGSGTVTVSGTDATGTVPSTWTNSGSLYIGGDASTAGGTGTLTVGFGGVVNVTDTLKVWDDGTVNLNGGTINTGALVFSGSTFNFNAGKLHFPSDPGLDAALLAKILGPMPTVSGDQHLSVAGRTLLLEPLILDGGTFSVGTLVNPTKLQFNTGTLNLTQDTLTIGLGGLLGRTVEVADGQTIQVTDNAQVDLTGALLISGGAFVPKSTVNFGEIRLGGGTSPGPALLAGGGLGNHGLIAGGGRISAPLTNFLEGLISTGPGQHLLLTGGENSNGGTMTTTGGEIDVLKALNNVGQINVIDGTFSVGGILMNVGPDSYISGQGNVTLRFGDVLSNNGTVGFSAATAGLYGEIYNGAGGLIAVAGQSTATFVGFIENEGEIFVGDGSKAVFLGHVSGPGHFPGGGAVEFVDGFTPSPGPSPAAVSFGGNVLFAPAASLEIELGGTVAGDEYDHLDIAGDLTPGGALQIVLIDEFLPEVGDTFDILDWDTLAGAEFDVVDTPQLVGRKAWDTSDLYDTGEISVIGMLDGDTDVDWDVDAVDLANFAEVFGGDGDWHTDFNGDGRVDLEDFCLMRANFGAGVGPAPGNDLAAATPEPATFTLLTIGGLAVLRRRSRGRRRLIRRRLVGS